MFQAALLFVDTRIVSAALAPASRTSTESTPSCVTTVGSQGSGPGWHEYGSVYLFTGTNVTWRELCADSSFDVTQTENRTILAGFMDGRCWSCGSCEPPCARTRIRVLDSRPESRVISEYGLPVRTKENSGIHGFEQVKSGEYLVTDSGHERIFTVKNGEVRWSGLRALSTMLLQTRRLPTCCTSMTSTAATRVGVSSQYTTLTRTSMSVETESLVLSTRIRPIRTISAAANPAN